jgi:hypothetical protein
VSGIRFRDLGHADLATLAREYLLAGHLIDRAGMPHLIGPYGREAMEAIAIDEWMGASPVYTRRVQHALGFGGDDVETVFKGMQFDIGAPPEFLDFSYRVLDADHGEFWLDHCGALADVEPMGDDFVRGMCHHIEDPTFEATVTASNPRARMTPVHRPPRTPTDRHPVCHWRVEIDPAADPLPSPGPAERVGSSRAAATVIEAVGSGEDHGPGLTDYGGPLDPDLRMEDFSARTLSVVVQEAALQGHLLVMSFLNAIRERHGAEAATAVGRRQFTGVAGVAAERLARALDLPASPAGLARLFELHPAFHPDPFIAWSVDDRGGSVRLELGPCDALGPAEPQTWTAMLADGHTAPLEAIARVLDPTSEVRPAAADPGGHAWEIRSGDVPHDEPSEVTVTKFSSGAAFEFVRVGRRR